MHFAASGFLASNNPEHAAWHIFVPANVTTNAFNVPFAAAYTVHTPTNVPTNGPDNLVSAPVLNPLIMHTLAKDLELMRVPVFAA